jgi:GT2 family glycosyltransferase
MEASTGTSLSVVIVTYNEREAIARTVPALIEQLAPGDELVISDNASTDGTVELVRELAPDAKIVQNGGNLGFAAACNSGAEAAACDLLLLLNPDAAPNPGFVEAIKRPHTDGSGWAAWMGLLTSHHGESLNCAGGEMHYAGVAWAGGMGQPASSARHDRHEVAWVSGGCFCLPLAGWREQGGFPPEFFIYKEDVDLSLRLRLEGGRLGIAPDAVVDHDYEFMKRKSKWRRLERNRWATVLRTYPGPLLFLVTPALLAAELAILPIAIVSGWGGQKLAAMWDTLRWLPRLLRERRDVQSRRTIGSAEFASWLTDELSSVNLGRPSRLAPLRWPSRAYWWVVRSILRVPGDPPRH